MNKDNNDVVDTTTTEPLTWRLATTVETTIGNSNVNRDIPIHEFISRAYETYRMIANTVVCDRYSFRTRVIANHEMASKMMTTTYGIDMASLMGDDTEIVKLMDEVERLGEENHKLRLELLTATNKPTPEPVKKSFFDFLINN